jgi:hypothetical protein
MPKQGKLIMKLQSMRFLFFCIAYIFSQNGFCEESVKWIYADTKGKGPEKVALLVPIYIEENKCYMQLDTGAPNAFYWYASNNKESKYKKVSVSFIGINKTLELSNDIIDAAKSCAESPIGTIGNENFEHGTLILNLKKAKVEYSEKINFLKNGRASPLFYTPKGHPLVQVYGNGKLLGYSIIDAGSASAEITVITKEWWNNLTQDSELIPGNNVDSFQAISWGKSIQCYYKNMKSQVSVGEHFKSQITVDYCPDLGFSYPLNIIGLVGLKYFGESTIYLDYRNGLWLTQVN